METLDLIKAARGFLGYGLEFLVLVCSGLKNMKKGIRDLGSGLGFLVSGFWVGFLVL